ncbi:hypothetical protein GCM10008939_30920 [Deinococcus aquiradiocola]|uniref:Phosphotransferase n=1 Tax=Deinococcus aquiradiocola TaxID=393059 RepID=A0A917PMM5_9DEIO|nr:hypothetical protein GCM10008939_30920 [Deinococcus aquiradiocola]
MSRALLRRFPFGLHLEIDALREQVVSGLAPPAPDHPPEAVRQFRLAHHAAVQQARLYAREGFEVVIDDVLWPRGVQHLVDGLHSLTVRRVFLAPGLDVALHRNATRTNKTYDTATLDPLIRSLHPSMPVDEYRAEGWTVLDTARLTAEQTVDALLATLPG